MSSTFFSIIIPTLNEETYLPKLLTSLVNQTYKDFEVIIVDANSTDETKNVALTFSDISITFINSDLKNTSMQRNKGAGISSSSYLLFLDADMTLPDSYLKDMREQIEIDHPDFASTSLRSEGNFLFDWVWFSVINNMKAVLTPVQKPYMSAQNLFFKRSAFNSLGGFDETVILAEDTELVQRAAKHKFKGKFYYKYVAITSRRRFSSDGGWNVLIKRLKALLYMTFKGPIRTQIFPYNMGGGYHKTQLLLEAQKKSQSKT